MDDNDEYCTFILSSSPARLQVSLRITLRMAKHRCFITNPYFVPPPTLLSAITRTARNGVDVRVLHSGDGYSDVPLMQWASQHIYRYLLKRNVRIYELQHRTLHAKTVSVDSIWSSIGTFNFDRISASMNLEVTVNMLCPGIARQLEDQFLLDVRQAREITLADLDRRAWWQRVLHWGAYVSVQVAMKYLSFYRSFG